MSSTLAQLRTRAKQRFRDTNNAIYSDAEWTAYINDAYTDVISDSPYWPFMRAKTSTFTYTAQAASMPLPGTAPDVFRVSEVMDLTDRYPLAPLFGAAAVESAYPYADTTFGNPLHYNIYNATIEIYPRPLTNVTLQIRYSISPPALVADGDTPVLPTQYQSALVYGALKYAYMDDGNLQASKANQDDFDACIEDMKSDLLSTQTENYPMIVDVWEWN